MDNQVVLDADHEKDVSSHIRAMITANLYTSRHIVFKKSKFEPYDEIDEEESLRSVYKAFHKAIQDRHWLNIDAKITPEYSLLHDLVEEVITVLSDVCESQAKQIKND